MAKLLYQGHASFRLTTAANKVVYIDPFAGEGYDKPADLVLITHEHYDHNAVQKILMTPRTIVIRAKDALAGGLYRSFEECGVRIDAVPAYNSHHSKAETVGYVITIDGVTIYHAGDTDYIPEMDALKERHIDYALLPIDGFYTMAPADATRASAAIAPCHMIPMHMKPGALWDYRQAMQVTSPVAMLMRPNEEIELHHGSTENS